MTSNKSEVLNGSSNSAPEDIPWLGDTTIRVRGLHASDAGKTNVMFKRVEASPEKDREAESLIEWFALGVCNEDDSPMFDESDLPVLRKLPLQAVQRVAQRIMEKSGFVQAGN